MALAWPTTGVMGMSDLESTDLPVRPKISPDADDIPQPRRVEWGHMSQVRGALVDDRVEILEQGRIHRFGHGTSDHGTPLPLYRGDLARALKVYRALDALFTGGEMEVGQDHE